MTEFEQQVAEALKRKIHDDGWCVNTQNANHEECSGRCQMISALLAPRVAAAIDDVAHAYAGDVRGGSEENNPAYREALQGRRTDALKALRGEL